MSEKEEEIKELKECADNGDEESIYLYACILNEGKEVEQNKEEAARYFKLAADQENPDAALEYGWMLDNGDTIQMNKVEATRYYEIAKKQDNILSIYFLTINKIIELIPSSKLFSNKLKSFEPILITIKSKLKEISNIEDCSKAQKNDLTKYLEAFSRMVENLNNDIWYIDFLKSKIQKIDKNKEPSNYTIKVFLEDINKSMKNILTPVNRLCHLVFNIPTENKYEDLKQIQQILSMPDYINDKSFDDKRKELDEFFKPIQHDFNSIIDKYDHRYKIKTSSYSKNDSSKIDKGDYETYEGTIKSTNEKVQIILLKNHENSDMLLSILCTIDNSTFKIFYGASITDSNIEFVIYDRGEPIKEDEVCLTILSFKIAEMMSYLHSKKIIYRDLNLSNILIEQNDESDITSIQPIITNFIKSTFLTDISFLGMANLIPTLTFSAPELTHNYRYDEKVDVFAFGGILYKFLTGREPYEGLSYEDVKQRLIDNERPTFPEGSPLNIVRLIEHCWYHKTKKHFIKTKETISGQECRYSFDQIIDEMIKEKIVFPRDESNREIIEKFYENHKIKNDDTIECLDLFESIISGTECAAQFQFEFHRARLVLLQNKNMIRHSKYAKKDTLDENERLMINQLKESLKNLLDLVINSQTHDLLNYITTKIDYFTDNLIKLMKAIHDIMNKLGIQDLEEYKTDENALKFDYTELTNYIEIEAKPTEIPDLNDNLNSFLETLQIDNEYFKETIFLTLKALLSPFEAKMVDRSDFYYYTLNPIDGVEAYVYQGYRISTSQKVAIKIVKDKYFDNSKNLISLRREISYLVSLHNEFIPKFIGFNLSNKGRAVWIITEFIPDKTLHYAKSDMNAYQKTKVAFEIAEAMEYLHDHRILHRDLKTTNIMMLNDSPRIIDFGLSRNELDNDTNTGKQGTHNYMAPEVYKGSKYGRAADVFSFAVILWELYTLKYPYENLSVFQVMKNILAGKRPELDDDCQENLKELINKGWDDDSDKRPTFTNIINDMIQKRISFLKNGENDERIESFYQNKEIERKKRFNK